MTGAGRGENEGGGGPRSDEADRIEERKNEFADIHAVFDGVRPHFRHVDDTTFGRAMWSVFSSNNRRYAPDGRDLREVFATWRFAASAVAARYGGRMSDYYCHGVPEVAPVRREVVRFLFAAGYRSPDFAADGDYVTR